MSDVRAQLREDLKSAMKAKDKQRTGTIRMLLAAVQEEETKGSKHELSEADLIQVVAREIKKRRESAQVYADNGRQELADAELAEVAVLEDYQPTQLSDEELSTLVDAAVAQVRTDTGEDVSMKHMGQVMKAAQAAAAGRADGKRLSTAVRERLQS
ncbi:GatB/YqeY domain-containing protein [Corynebacterium uberis]|uniref:GatB/YqeY domain-containing protein n=1 Tax=Corynebacterium TaxID=1716 RepID=UPI001D0B281B|nr:MULTISPECIES: GatB/YqeY domain-containing protein [Corynebacterium]MCZ9309938.1 GatB/YqeY domain-containing protein [Corynebacterium sp. c6VSa_13]UDL73142.1 GatB/YqeY domain-containing protein [Corynebacterium uberis]UDL78193.1 GatB/YqeY domain-containing protein [Corynebacterium uberis]UDL82611.1 GatB/YqeY domain-containing protein [Corynebacterium uberis]UDL84818.1 GatB/YqeY domain-containing protein [Corynebacterium uberis]